MKSMKFDLRDYLTSVITFLGLALTAMTVHASTTFVGRADLVVGQVRIQSASGAAVQLAHAGQKIYEGSILETGPDGYLYIQTIDKGFISLRPQTRVTIELYRYDVRQPQASQIRLVLHKGVMRAITGQGAQAARDQYRLNTPVAALGIRGTDYTVFANEQMTRVSVASGGVVLAPLGPDCRVNALGPCAGQNSLALSASTTTVLQVVRGDLSPKLIESPDIKPDRTAPPRSDETIKGRAATTGADLGTRPDSVAALSNPTETVVAPQLLQTSSPPEATIFWGRWRELAQLKSPAPVSDIKTDSRDWVALGNPFFLVRDRSAVPVLPPSGQYHFQMGSYEAYLLRSFTNQTIPAIVENGQLMIQLDDRTFTTQFDFVSSGYKARLTSRGVVAEDGRFYNDLFAYGNTRVQGAVSGVNAQEAATLFNHTIDSKNSAVGAIRWSR